MRKVFIALLLATLCVAGVWAYLRSPLPGRPEPAEESEESTASEEKTPAARLAVPLGSWPRFRGPDGLGISTDTEVPLEWNEKKNLRWKTALPGPGSSSPVVWGDRIFVTCYTGYGDGSEGKPNDLRRHLLAIRRDDGKVLWSREVAPDAPEDAYRGYLTQHGYASSTPAVDAEHVYVFFGKTGVLAFDHEGNSKWKTSVGTRSANRRWGSAASLLLYRDLVIVNASEESRAIKALDCKTGKQVWEAEGRKLELCYGTPILVETEGGRQELVVALPGEVWGLHPDSGKLRWYARTDLEGNVSPSVVAHNGIIFATGGYPGTYTVAIRAGGRGDVTASHLLWSVNDASYVPSPVAHGEHLYLFNDQGVAICLEATTGKQVHRVRMPGVAEGRTARPVYASPLRIHDRLIAVTRTAGTFVVTATPKLERLGINRLAGDDSDFNGSPAVSRGQLFLRSNRYLYCVGADAR
ncbi:MAG: PQQ-binding-like beta-propeller repeat protein [Gemmataceae bacterium]